MGRSSITLKNEHDWHNLKKPSNVRSIICYFYQHNLLWPIHIPIQAFLGRAQWGLGEGEEVDFITLKVPSNISELNFGDSRKSKGHVIKSAPTGINDKDCS